MQTWLEWLEKCGLEFKRTDNGETVFCEYDFGHGIKVFKGEKGAGSRGGMVEVNGYRTSHGSVKALTERILEVLEEEIAKEIASKNIVVESDEKIKITDEDIKLIIQKSEETNGKGKLIAQFSLEGQLKSVNYRNYYLQNGFHTNNISKCCNGKLQTVNGYIWRYVTITGNLNEGLKISFLPNKNMKVVKANCPYCKTEHIIREVEVETELNMTIHRAEVDCDCGRRFFVDYNRKSLRKK